MLHLPGGLQESPHKGTHVHVCSSYRVKFSAKKKIEGKH